MTSDDGPGLFQLIVFGIASFVATVVGLTIAAWITLATTRGSRTVVIVIAVFLGLVAAGMAIRARGRSASAGAAAVGMVLGLIVFGGCLAILVQ